MQLKSFTIRRREAWEKGEDLFRGELTAGTGSSEVKVKLTDEQCRQILLIAAPTVVQAAEATANLLISEANNLTLEAPKQLEGGAA